MDPRFREDDGFRVTFVIQVAGTRMNEGRYGSESDRNFLLTGARRPRASGDSISRRQEHVVLAQAGDSISRRQEHVVLAQAGTQFRGGPTKLDPREDDGLQASARKNIGGALAFAYTPGRFIWHDVGCPAMYASIFLSIFQP
jgi:hypothetical protein